MDYPRGVQGSIPWPPLVRKLGASNVGLPWAQHGAMPICLSVCFVLPLTQEQLPASSRRGDPRGGCEASGLG